jgi:formate hydrogenlyase subunit 4
VILDILSRLAALAIVIAMAPLVPGIATRTRGVLTGRRGAPVWQLYADLWKLVRRGLVYSRTVTTVFRLTPVLQLAVIFVAALLLPLNGRSSFIAFPGDVVAFAYLIALGRFVLVLAALDTGSSFEGMGASREVTFAALGEFVALAALSIASHELSLNGMLGPALSGRWPVSSPALVMVAMSLFVLLLAEGSRSPVDDPTTHLELTMIHEVMILDHSGPDLAVILYASAFKLSVLGALLVRVAAPANLSVIPRFAALIVGLLVLGVVIGIVESSMARLRLPKVPLYLAGGTALSAFGLILLLR